MRKALLPLLLVTPLIAVALATPATAAPGVPGKPLKCLASDGADVRVDKKANTVAIFNDTTTGGNNFGCFTDLAVVAGDIITFSHTSTVCGGGVPRLFIRFADGTSDNTHDGNLDNCTVAVGSTLGTQTYSIKVTGTITAFAFINDAGEGTVTYSNLVIDGNVIDF